MREQGALVSTLLSILPDRMLLADNVSHAASPTSEADVLQARALCAAACISAAQDAPATHMRGRILPAELVGCLSILFYTAGLLLNVGLQLVCPFALPRPAQLGIIIASGSNWSELLCSFPEATLSTQIS